MAEKLSGLSETLGKETSRGDGSLPMRQVSLERIAAHSSDSTTGSILSWIKRTEPMLAFYAPEGRACPKLYRLATGCNGISRRMKKRELPAKSILFLRAD